MKKAILTLVALILLTASAEAILLLQVSLDPGRVAAFFACFTLALTAFVGLTYPAIVRRLRHWAGISPWIAAGLPFLLLVPYLIYALGTETFSSQGLGKLAAYVAVPTLLLLPDRTRRAERVGWRDIAAMLALAVPISGRWLVGIWTWPHEIYFFRPLFCVGVGAYGFLVIRGLEDVGYRLVFRKGDVIDGLANFIGFAIIVIPLGHAINFIQFEPKAVRPLDFALQFFGIYLIVAIPEELLFRGIFQNFLAKSLPGPRRGLYALIIASIVFGAAHLHHSPVPNWRYGILAAIAGLFYGNAYRTRHRISASAFTHTLVNTVWHFWF